MLLRNDVRGGQGPWFGCCGRMVTCIDCAIIALFTRRFRLNDYLDGGLGKSKMNSFHMGIEMGSV